MDGFFRLSESHQLNMMVSHSSTSATGKQGLSGFAQYYYVNNQWKFWWTQSFVSKNFNPEMGFVSRNDVIATTPGIFWYYRGKNLPFPKLIRAFEPGAWFEMYHQASTGQLTERTVSLNPVWFNFQQGGYIGYIVNHSFQRLPETFSPVGIDILAGDYNYFNHQIYYSTDPSRKISGASISHLGIILMENLPAPIPGCNSPLPRISVCSPNTTGLTSTKWVHQPLVKTDLYTVSGRFALNPRIQLIGFTS